MARTGSLITETISLRTAGLIEDIGLTTGALNAIISRGFVARAWRNRAQWMGYARALQLQGVEIDEIDVISWATGVEIPGRQANATLIDPFEHYAGWRSAIADRAERHWREDLPFTPITGDAFARAPRLLRAIEIVGQYARADKGIDPWLALPILLSRLHVTPLPLPCLVGGDKAMRAARYDGERLGSAILRDLRARSIDGLAIARGLEADRRRWIRALSTERRPGLLRALAILWLGQSVFRPEQLAQRLGITRSGAGKLLERAAEHGLLQEVSGRRSWRVYLAPDMARRLGFAPPLRGRPRKAPTLPKEDLGIGATLASFDAEMATLVARYPELVSGGETDDEQQLSIYDQEF